MTSNRYAHISAHRIQILIAPLLAASLTTWAIGQPGGSAVQESFDDHQNMMDQLGIKSLRPGADPNNQSIFDEATANPYHASMPDPLVMNDGDKVIRPEQWPRRRAEIAELFEREVYGRIPANVPEVSWEVTSSKEREVGGVPVITRTLVGHVDNSAYPGISVDIQAQFTVPVDTDQPRPIMIEFDGFGGRFGRPDGTVPWTEQAIAHGWAYGSINPGSIQPDNNNFRAGIIGLTNRGQPRKPDDWGALRAWGWGVGQLIDFFAANPDLKIDSAKVGIEGVSRYGKAALVTEAFDERVAVAFVASSGEGGAKLHRHIFGEALENLTGGGYYWMAGNFMKYGAAEAEFGPKTAADLPVDSHELIALCAPRPCFISYGIVERGDPPWVDARGSFMAGVLAGPVYQLLGKQGFGTEGNYLTDPMPPVNQLIGGELAWRQHDGGHTSTPNWPTFFEWVSQYISAPPPPKENRPQVKAESQVQPVPRAALNGVVPISRTDENSKIAHEQLVAKAKAGGIDLYFLGDSITRRWGCTDPQWSELMANWKKNFFGWNAANFGWGADGIQNMLWRVQNGELEGVNPKVIVILAGTNDVGNQPGGDEKVPDILKRYRALITACREIAPDAKIILTAIFPRNDNPKVLPEIKRINEEISKYADSQTVFYLNVNDKLADPQGNLFDGMTVDKLHLSAKGYQVWADGLQPLLTRFLGPPAETDHAPPPTADPSLGPPDDKGNS